MCFYNLNSKHLWSFRVRKRRVGSRTRRRRKQRKLRRWLRSSTQTTRKELRGEVNSSSSSPASASLSALATSGASRTWHTKMAEVGLHSIHVYISMHVSADVTVLQVPSLYLTSSCCCSLDSLSSSWSCRLVSLRVSGQSQRTPTVLPWKGSVSLELSWQRMSFFTTTSSSLGASSISSRVGTRCCRGTAAITGGTRRIVSCQVRQFDHTTLCTFTSFLLKSRPVRKGARGNKISHFCVFISQFLWLYRVSSFSSRMSWFLPHGQVTAYNVDLKHTVYSNRSEHHRIKQHCDSSRGILLVNKTADFLS